MIKINSQIQVNTLDQTSIGFSKEVLKKRLYARMIEEIDKSDCFTIQKTSIDIDTIQYDLSLIVLKKDELAKIVGLINVIDTLSGYDIKVQVDKLKEVILGIR
jgi:hypothetical protein